MKKLNDLRKFLLDSVHELKQHPDKLQIWLDAGAIDANLAAPRLAYKYRYTAQVLVTEYNGNPNSLIIPILFFLKQNQTDATEQNTLKFEAEIINHDCADVLFEIEFSEKIVTDIDNGNIEMVVCEERTSWFTEISGMRYTLYDTDGKEVVSWQS